MEFNNERIRTVRYKNNSGSDSERLPEAAYVNYGKEIVFAGIHIPKNVWEGSATDCVARIIHAIAVTEKITLNRRRIKFCQLQTHSCMNGFLAGDYLFAEVSLNLGPGNSLPICPSWTEDVLKPHIMRDFEEVIWGKETPGEPRNLAPRYYGRKLPEKQEDFIGTILGKRQLQRA